MFKLSKLPIGADYDDSSSVAIEGEPDQVFYFQPTGQRKGEMLVAIEIRTRWVIHDPGDVIELFHRKARKFTPFLQLFQYQYLGDDKYGVLTTYNQTWFVKVETTQQGRTMRTSPVLEHTTTNPSILRCYAVIIDLPELQHDLSVLSREPSTFKFPAPQREPTPLTRESSFLFGRPGSQRKSSYVISPNNRNKNDGNEGNRNGVFQCDEDEAFWTGHNMECLNFDSASNSDKADSVTGQQTRT